MSTSVPYMEVLHLEDWAERNKADLLPPVCNKLVYGAGMWKVMIVGGPNDRRDYHIEEGEEFFFQLSGEMCLKIMDRGRPRDVRIGEGQVFMLPARIPHSPNRFENTVGLVMERERRAGEMDCLRFYTNDHAQILWEEWFHCTDLGKDLTPCIERFMQSEARRSGRPSANMPLPLFDVDVDTAVGEPLTLADWIARERGKEGAPAACTGVPLFADPDRVDSEFAVEAYWGPCRAEGRARIGEVLLLQRKGIVSVQVSHTGNEGPQELKLGPGAVVLLPSDAIYALRGEDDDCVGVEFYLRMQHPRRHTPE